MKNADFRVIISLNNVLEVTYEVVNKLYRPLSRYGCKRDCQPILHIQAVADKNFKDILNVQKPEVAPLMAYHEDKIELISYAPNCLEYRAQTEQNKVAVFSEIYYPHDWHLYVVDQDGNNSVEIPLARVNYTLRAAVIPAGAHQLRMVFEPHALKSDKASMAILILALLLSAGALTSPLWRKKK